jgi:hypothetical protein
MLTTLIVSTLAAGPRAPADAQWALYAPKVGQLATFAPFFKRAGERSVLLRPASWREDFHPLLSIELTRPEDLTNAGIDLNGSATVSESDDFVYTCVQLESVERYEQKCLQRLGTLGTHFRELKDGVIRAGARDTLGRVLAGYVLKGKESCAVRGKGRSVEPKLDVAAKFIGKNATSLPFKLAEGLPGVVQLFGKQGGVLVLRGGELSLMAEGKAKGITTAGLLGPGPSPFALASPDGLSWMRIRGDRTRLEGAADQVVRTLMQVCFACDRTVLEQVVKGMLPQLGGNGLAYAREVQLRGSLKTMAGRYFSLRNVLLADVLDEKAAREALAPLGKQTGVKPLASGEGFSVTLKEGEIRFGVRGKFLYISNDEKALDVALRSTAKGEGNQAHGFELRADTRKVARALAAIPLLDAIGSQDLAGMVMLAGELGPLLLGSEKIYAWLDPTGPDTSRGHLEWMLLPVEQKLLPDGGALPDGGMLPDGGLLDGGELLDGGGALDGGTDAGVR